jgi:hypothetical protein
MVLRQSDYRCRDGLPVAFKNSRQLLPICSLQTSWGQLFVLPNKKIKYIWSRSGVLGRDAISVTHFMFPRFALNAQLLCAERW